MKRIALALALSLVPLPAAATASRYFTGASLSGTLASSYAAPVSFSCWCNADVDGIGSLLALTDAGTGYAYSLKVTESGGKEGASLEVIGSDGTDSGGYAGTVPNSEWMHLAGGVDGAGNRKIALNGAITTNMEAVTDPSVDETWVASLWHASTFDGFIAHCAIWEVYLSDKDVEQLATGMLPYHVKPEKLIGYWPVMGNDSPETGKDGNDPVALTVSSATASAEGPPVWSK